MLNAIYTTIKFGNYESTGLFAKIENPTVILADTEPISMDTPLRDFVCILNMKSKSGHSFVCILIKLNYVSTSGHIFLCILKLNTYAPDFDMGYISPPLILSCTIACASA